jgi:hypothetical protein
LLPVPSIELFASGVDPPWALHEFLDRCERLAVDPGPLLYATRMAAKVHSSALQDEYQLYYHAYAMK